MPNHVRLEIERREPFAGGKTFGAVGPYERLLGKAYYAVDPAEAGLPYICDLELAPRNTVGLIEFSGTLDIVKPVEPRQSADPVRVLESWQPGHNYRLQLRPRRGHV